MEIECSVQIFKSIGQNNLQIYLVILERIPGYETIWIIGDKFVTKAIGHLLKNDENDWYMSRNYNVKLFMDNSLSLNRRTVSRMCNNLITAINELKLLPKIISVIVDTDLIEKTISPYSYVTGALLHWLMSEFDKIIKSHKDRIQSKARKVDYPTFIWMAPHQHTNFTTNDLRMKIDKVLKNTTTTHHGHTMMRLKKYSDFNNRSLFQAGAYTNHGWETFWSSIDSAIQFWDRHLSPKNIGANFQQIKSDSNTSADTADLMCRFFVSNAASSTYHYGGRGKHNGKKGNHHGGFSDKFHWNGCHQLPKPR